MFPPFISQQLFPESPDPADSHGDTHRGLWGGSSTLLQAGREQTQLFASKQIPRLCLALVVFFSSLTTPACGHKCQEPSSKLQLSSQGGDFQNTSVLLLSAASHTRGRTQPPRRHLPAPIPASHSSDTHSLRLAGARRLPGGIWVGFVQLPLVKAAFLLSQVCAFKLCSFWRRNAQPPA